MSAEPPFNNRYTRRQFFGALLKSAAAAGVVIVGLPALPPNEVRLTVCGLKPGMDYFAIVSPDAELFLLMQRARDAAMELTGLEDKAICQSLK